MAIKKYYEQFPKDQITAKVKESNIASNKVFEKLGFEKIKVLLISGIKYRQYIMKSN